MARNSFFLVAGEPATVVFAVESIDPASGAAPPIDVAVPAVPLHVHERDSDEAAAEPRALAPLTPPVAARGAASFTEEETAALRTDREYTYRLRLGASGESIDAGDVAVLRAWR